MNWNTIYITGKSGFEKEVLHNLENSTVNFMPGSMSELDNFSLFWISDKTSLRSFKKAIGGKTVFKYRLTFYCSLEELNQIQENSQTEKFTPQEESMIREMSDWQEERPMSYKNSA
jgi:hypothetical protein